MYSLHVFATPGITDVHLYSLFNLQHIVVIQLNFDIRGQLDLPALIDGHCDVTNATRNRAPLRVVKESLHQSQLIYGYIEEN